MKVGLIGIRKMIYNLALNVRDHGMIQAIRLQVPAPVITNSLFVRYPSQDQFAFSNPVVAALRNEFGGHKLHKK